MEAFAPAYWGGELYYDQAKAFYAAVHGGEIDTHTRALLGRALLLGSAAVCLLQLLCSQLLSAAPVAPAHALQVR